MLLCPDIIGASSPVLLLLRCAVLYAQSQSGDLALLLDCMADQSRCSEQQRSDPARTGTSDIAKHGTSCFLAPDTRLLKASFSPFEHQCHENSCLLLCLHCWSMHDPVGTLHLPKFAVVNGCNTCHPQTHGFKTARHTTFP